MKSLIAFLQKECCETVRSGKLTVLLILFFLLGVFNPAIAKLTPWMLEILADSLADSGMTVTTVTVDALTSWIQFFKNIPIGLIAFLLLYSGTFTKEYQSSTLTLVLTKGLARFKVVLAKFVWMVILWSIGYWLCFAVTYGYNACFWDNGIAHHLCFSAGIWWLFGVWTIALTVLFSVLLRSSAGVLLGTGGLVLVAYGAGAFPKIGEYSPTYLLQSTSLLYGSAGIDAYVRAVITTVIISAVCIAVSIPIINKKQI